MSKKHYITQKEEQFSEALPRVSEWRHFRRVFLQRKIVLFGLIILFILFFCAAFAKWLAPYDPYKTNMLDSLQKPCKKYWLGTDLQGRDVLSRLIYGARTTVVVGFLTVFTAASAGMFMGITAGYFGGALGMIIMRFVDALMAFPMILLALIVAAVIGSGLHNVVIALSVATTPGYARVMYGLTLSIKENDYVIAAKAMGAKNTYIMYRHILPNAFPPMIVLITLQLGTIILAEAGLSFLGIGIKPPGAAWGAMVYDGYKYLLTHPLLSFAPGFAIMLVVFAFNMVGDGLRDAFDPRLRGLL